MFFRFENEINLKLLLNVVNFFLIIKNYEIYFTNNILIYFIFIGT